jgi:hypothetical protein
MEPWNHGTFAAHPGAMDSYPGSTEAHPRAMQSHLGAKVARPEAAESCWRLSMEVLTCKKNP